MKRTNDVQNDYKIIAGDFNTMLNPDEDRKGGADQFNREASRWVNDFIKADEIIK